jgi:hypothetical protein
MVFADTAEITRALAQSDPFSRNTARVGAGRRGEWRREGRVMTSKRVVQAGAIVLLFLIMGGAITVLAFFLSDEGAPRVGDTVSLSTSHLGCTRLEDWNKITKLMVTNHDLDAAATYSIAHPCRELPASEDYQIEDSSIWSNAVCLHLRGVPDCLWTKRQFLKAAK